MSQIRVSDEQKEAMLDMRLHPKETYEDTLKRLLGWWKACEHEDCHRMGPMDGKMKDCIRNALEKKFGVICVTVVEDHEGIVFHMKGNPEGTPVWIPKR